MKNCVSLFTDETKNTDLAAAGNYTQLNMKEVSTNYENATKDLTTASKSSKAKEEKTITCTGTDPTDGMCDSVVSYVDRQSLIEPRNFNLVTIFRPSIIQYSG